MSVSASKIGDVLVARNDLAGALKAYEEGLEIARRLAAADPSHAKRARDVFSSLVRIVVQISRSERLRLSIVQGESLNG